MKSLNDIITNFSIGKITKEEIIKEYNEMFFKLLTLYLNDKNSSTLRQIITCEVIGIKSNEVDEIFNPFFTTKEVGKGTGLGLAICLKIINDHKGKIKVNSVQNEETTFELIIPKSGEKNL